MRCSMAEPSAAVVKQAIAWMVHLQSGQASADDQSRYQHWRQASPTHELACARLEAIGGQVRTLPPQLAHAALTRNTVPLHRRAALRSVVMLAGGVAAVWWGERSATWQWVAADLSTSVGERRSVTLPDGSQLQLNTDSAVDVQFDSEQRLLHLRRGEILVSTAAPTGRYRPFRVRTAQGVLTALGTRFRVHQQDDVSQVAVYQGAVAVQPLAGAALRLQAGSQADFDAQSVTRPTAADADLAAWSDGVIVARNQRLGQFVTELARHRPGLLTCDDTAADLRISGVFPLANTDRVLSALERTLPVTVQRRTRLWVTVLPKR